MAAYRGVELSKKKAKKAGALTVDDMRQMIADTRHDNMELRKVIQELSRELKSMDIASENTEPKELVRDGANTRKKLSTDAVQVYSRSRRTNGEPVQTSERSEDRNIIRTNDDRLPDQLTDGASPPPITTTSSLCPFIIKAPAADDEGWVFRSRDSLESKYKRQRELLAELERKSTEFEAALREFVLADTSLKASFRQHNEYIEENQRLKSELGKMTNRNAALENALAQQDERTKYLMNQADVLMTREREMEIQMRRRDEQLRTVKEIFDRSPTEPRSEPRRTGVYRH